MIIKFSTDWYPDVAAHKNDPTRAHLVVLHEASCRGDIPIPHLVRAVTTCRQIHTETSILLFKLNTLQLCPTELSRFLDNLTTIQRDAISSFRVGLLDSLESGFVGIFVHYWSRIKASGFDAWSGLQCLARMGGLERVIVDKRCMDELKPRPSVEAVIVQVQAYARGRNVEVIFEDTPELEQ